MRPRRPIKATPEQVRISREGEDGIIDYADPRYGSMRLRIGPQVAVMTDAEILAMANDVIDAQNRMVVPSRKEGLAKPLPQRKTWHGPA